jgi:Zn-dependent alcohol dehydrogenase
MRAAVLFEQGKPQRVEDAALEGDEGAGVVEVLGPGVIGF